MYYTVYKITNKINQKIYIGVHKTTNIEDNYMGSGKHLKRAKEKYGIENFEKNIIEIFDTPEMMYQYEALLVNEEFVVSVNTYNLKVGGYGGWNYINNNVLDFNSRSIIGKKGAIAYINKLNSDDGFKNNMFKIQSESGKKRFLSGELDSFVNSYNWTGKQHKPESIEKMKFTHKENKHQLGEKNSQFGSMWIYNEELKENKKIHKDEIIPDGWKKGRKINFK